MNSRKKAIITHKSGSLIGQVTIWGHQSTDRMPGMENRFAPPALSLPAQGVCHGLLSAPPRNPRLLQSPLQGARPGCIVICASASISWIVSSTVSSKSSGGSVGSMGDGVHGVWRDSERFLWVAITPWLGLAVSHLFAPGRKLRPTGRGGNALFRTFPVNIEPKKCE